MKNKYFGRVRCPLDLGNRMFMYAFVYGITRKTNRTFYYKGNLYTINLLSKVENAVNILTYDQCYAFKMAYVIYQK